MVVGGGGQVTGMECRLSPPADSQGFLLWPQPHQVGGGSGRNLDVH